MTVSRDEIPPSDSALIAAVRRGDVGAYGHLYSRHLGSARAVANQLCSSSTDADDAVSEAFAKVLQALRKGNGPQEAFRAYLLQAIRHNVYNRARRDKKLALTDDLERHAPPTEFEDRAEMDLERSMAARAFRQLPERWQTVLWHTAVEGQRTAEVAEILGTSPNNVTSLAYRAREALRQAYLDCHLTDHPESSCADHVRQLGAYARDGLRPRAQAKVQEHLDDCAECRGLLTEVSDVSSAMRAVVGPLVLGFAVERYLDAQATGGDLVPTSASTGAGVSDHGAIGRWVQGSVGAVALIGVVVAALFLTDPHDEAQSAPLPEAAPEQPVLYPGSMADPAARQRLGTSGSGQAVAPGAPSARRPTAPRPGVVPPPARDDVPPRDREDRRPASDDEAGQSRPRPADPSTPRSPGVQVPAPAAPEPEEPAVDPAVDVTIGDPAERFAETTVPLRVRNRTQDSAAPRMTLTLPERTHLLSAGGGGCQASGSGRSVSLDCADLADGASHDISVVIGPDDNGDGTFSDQQGDLDVVARMGETSGSATRFVRVVCE